MSRRILGLVVGLALLVAISPAAVSGGSLIREAHSHTFLSCEGLAGASGEVFLYAEISDEWGSFAAVAIWTDTAAGPPDIITSESSVVVTASGAAGVFQLVQYAPSPNPDEPPFGDPAGSATLNATFTPDGDAVRSSYVDRDGNRVLHVETAVQAYTVTGSLAIDLLSGSDGTYALGTCSAGTETRTIAGSNPTAYVNGEKRVGLRCEWITADGIVVLTASSDGWGTYSDVYIRNGPMQLSGFTDAVLTSSLFEAEFALFDSETWEPVSGASASATAILQRTSERVRSNESFGNRKFIASGWVLAVDGTLTVALPGGSTTLLMNDATCDAEEVRLQEIVTKVSGPKLKNDAPSGALPLPGGTTLQVRTGGTAAEAEEPCVVVDGDHTHDIPISHTAWWTFTGTGNAMTIDSAGSNFDTVIGVYILDGGTYTLVGCVDDIFDPDTGMGSLQSKITFDTIAGQTYYVQAGGYAGSAGTLYLRLE